MFFYNIFLIICSIHLVLLFFFIAPSESVLCVGINVITGGLLGLGLCEASNLSRSKNFCESDCKGLDLDLNVCVFFDESGGRKGVTLVKEEGLGVAILVKEGEPGGLGELGGLGGPGSIGNPAKLSLNYPSLNVLPNGEISNLALSRAFGL